MPAERAPSGGSWRDSAPVLMVGSALLFSAVGVCVKIAADLYGSGEIVFYRGVVGVLFIAWVMAREGQSARSSMVGLHLGRSITGTIALVLWFISIAGLPLATASTLNYLSSVWVALFAVAAAVLFGHRGPDWRLVGAVLVGFAGVALILRPAVAGEQLLHGLAGLASGVFAAMAYLQLKSLARAGEPDSRIVLYFCATNVAAGAGLMLVQGPREHTWPGVALLLLIGLLAAYAQVMLTRAYSSGRVLALGTLQYVGILFAFAWGVLLFGEAVTLLAVAGGLLIVAAGIVATRVGQGATEDTSH